MEEEHLPAVTGRRQNGPGPLWIGVDGGVERKINIGEWISAQQPVPMCGELTQLPADAKEIGAPFQLSGETVRVFTCDEAVQAQRAEDDGVGQINPPEDHDQQPAPEADDAAGHPRLTVKADITSLVAIISDRIDAPSGEVTPPIMRVTIAALPQLPPSVRWVSLADAERYDSIVVAGQYLHDIDKADSTTAPPNRQIGDLYSREMLDAAIAAGRASSVAELQDFFAMLKPAPIEPMPNVAVVVTVHDSWHLADRCLQSLVSCEAGGGVLPRVIVVDDGSCPFVAYQLRERCNELGFDLLVNETRQGYIAAVNRGVKEAFALGYDFACILNSDTMVTDGWLFRMLRAAESRPNGDVGMVGPLSSNAVHLSIPGEWLAGQPPHIVAAKLALVSDRKYPETITPTGFCLLIRRDLWEKHGPFQPLAGEAYGEETELWAKMVKDGGIAVAADDAFVWHQGHGSYDQDTSSIAERAAVTEFMRRYGDVYRPRNERFIAERGQQLDYMWPRLAAIKKTLPPRVCFVVNEYGLYGGMLTIVQIANGLIERGWDARIATKVARPDALAAIPSLAPPIVFDDMAQLINRFGSEVFDEGIIVATLWNTAEYVSRICESNPGLKPIYFIQDDETTFVAPGGKEYTAASNVHNSYRLIGPKVVNSTWVLNKMVNELNVPASECTFLPVGVDTRLFHPRPRDNPDRPTVLMFSRPETPRRGGDMVKSVAEILTEQHEGINVLTFGDRDRRLGFRVEQLGRLPQSQVAKVFAQADVFLEASTTQGFGLQGLEAMASGCALVSTRNRGIDNYGQAGVNCELVDVDDAVGAAAAIVALLCDHERRAAYVSAGRKTAESFDWRGIVERWESRLGGLL